MGSDNVRMSGLIYLGGETIELNGAAIEATLPGKVEVFELRAEGGSVFFEMNSTIASATSSGFCPENWIEIQGVLANLQSLWVFGAANSIAHLLYYAQKV